MLWTKAQAAVDAFGAALLMDAKEKEYTQPQ